MSASQILLTIRVYRKPTTSGKTEGLEELPNYLREMLSKGVERALGVDYVGKARRC